MVSTTQGAGPAGLGAERCPANLPGKFASWGSATGSRLGLGMVAAVAEHKMNAALSAGQNRLLGVLRGEQQGDDIDRRRFPGWIRLHLMAGGQNFGILQDGGRDRIGMRSRRDR